MTVVGECLSQPVAAHDAEGTTIDDARPADAIRGGTQPRLPPVVIGGKAASGFAVRAPRAAPPLPRANGDVRPRWHIRRG